MRLAVKENNVILPETDIVAIFSNIETIHKLNENVYKSLKKILMQVNNQQKLINQLSAKELLEECF